MGFGEVAILKLEGWKEGFARVRARALCLCLSFEITRRQGRVWMAVGMGRHGWEL